MFIGSLPGLEDWYYGMRQVLYYYEGDFMKIASQGKVLASSYRGEHASRGDNICPVQWPLAAKPSGPQSRGLRNYTDPVCPYSAGPLGRGGNNYGDSECLTCSH